MISLSQIESDLTSAMKAKIPLKVETLRGLKTRLFNEKISKQKDLTEEEITALIRSEVKRRKDAEEAYASGNRPELAQKEHAEIEILSGYLPAQLSEEEIIKVIDAELSAGSYTAKDFGAAMGKVKAKLGSSADGATIAKLLKEKLK
jgi:uncharacterized protein YqeY